MSILFTWCNYSVTFGHAENQEICKKIVSEAKSHLLDVSSVTIRGKNVLPSVIIMIMLATYIIIVDLHACNEYYHRINLL